MKTFDHLPFPYFDDATLAATEIRVGPLLDVVARAVVENGSLATTRDALLPQLMSGKLRVKDAELRGGVVIAEFVRSVALHDLSYPRIRFEAATDFGEGTSHVNF